MPSGTKAPPLNGWLRAALSGTLGDTNWTNIFWLAYDAGEAEGVVTADFNTIAAGFDNAWLAGFGPVVTTSVILKEVHLLLKRASGEFADVYTFASSGAVASDPVDCPVQAVVNWQTHAYYKGGHPKTFVPGVPRSHVASQRLWDGGLLSSLASHMGTWIADLEALVTTHLVTTPRYIAPSFVHANAYRAVPIERHISGASVQPRLGVQRRRLGDTVH